MPRMRICSPELSMRPAAMQTHLGLSEGRMILLKPQHLKDYYFSEIEEQLRKIFFAEVLEPIVGIVRDLSP